MAKKVKLAFIGCGGIAAHHLSAEMGGLGQFPDVEFVGWCDVNEAAAEARRAQVGDRGDVYTNAKKMLDQTRPDAVYIMLPPFAHGPSEKLVIERKLPFFIEKPVAIDMPTARRIAAGVKRARLITSVGFMSRYRQGVRRVRDLLAKQKPVIMHGGWTGGGVGYNIRWWHQKDKSGGQFLEQTIHTVDLARYFFGEVTRVYAVPINDRRRQPSFVDIEQASMVQLTFAGGAAANLYSTTCTPIGGDVTLEIFATGMKARLDGWGCKTTIELAGGEKVNIPDEDGIFGIEDRVFIDAVKAAKRGGIEATYEDGVKATQIACAANKSMETGKVIQLRH